MTFCHVDWGLAARQRSPERLVASFQQSARAGARGLKVWKDLGLERRDPQGQLLLPDNPRLGPLWDTAGALGLPVLIHTGDPVAFFPPCRPPQRTARGAASPSPAVAVRTDDVPPLERLIDALEATVAAHPGTRFIGAHVAGLAEDLTRADQPPPRTTTTSGLTSAPDSVSSAASLGPPGVSSNGTPTACSSQATWCRRRPRTMPSGCGSWRPTTRRSPTPRLTRRPPGAGPSRGWACRAICCSAFTGTTLWRFSATALPSASERRAQCGRPPAAERAAASQPRSSRPASAAARSRAQHGTVRRRSVEGDQPAHLTSPTWWTRPSTSCSQGAPAAAETSGTQPDAMASNDTRALPSETVGRTRTSASRSSSVCHRRSPAPPRLPSSRRPAMRSR